jgi:lipopolysaccharide/colanic/teichoic acid biosynthesis glycosyltransferase
MLKRSFDITASIIGLILLSPIFIIISILIKSDSKGPIIFRQERIGLRGISFRIHKFRTMRVDAEAGGRLSIGKDSRITKMGYYLRAYKLDELIQLLDVLRGTMSLVGPRPEVEEFIEQYPREIRRKILSVRPGITDLASIEMVDENKILASCDDPKRAYIDKILPIKQKYYIDYVDNQSFIGDIKIIVLTIIKIWAR